MLDLAPQRKFHPELQKSVSFSKWKGEEDDHPLVRNVEGTKKTEEYDERKEKRASSPTESQKAKLETLRAAVKSDLRRAIMKRTHSPDSSGDAVGAFLKNNFPSASQKLMSLEVESQDLSVMTPSSYESNGSWKDDLSESFAGKETEFSVDGLDWEDLDATDDDGALTVDSQSTTGCLKPAWSMQPLDTFSDGAESEQQLVKLMGECPDKNDHRFYRHKSLGVSGGKRD